MTYPKALMTIKELEKMGFSRKKLMEIFTSKGYPIAFKENPKKKTSLIKFDTEELQKYLRHENKMAQAERGIL